MVTDPLQTPAPWNPPFSDHFLARGYDLEALVDTHLNRVYRARRPRDGRQVAIKILCRVRAAAAAAAAGEPADKLGRRFEREVEILAALEGHPHAPVLIEAGTVAGAPYHICTWVEGEPIGAFILGGEPRRLRETVDLAIGVARAAGALHQSGVAHRDLSPEQVIVGPDGTVRLIDFGMADRLDRRPERAVNLLRHDIFAIGLILCELLLGQAIFSYGQPRLAREARLVARALRESSLPGPLLDAIERSLATSPFPADDATSAAPYASVAELAGALTTCLDTYADLTW